MKRPGEMRLQVSKDTGPGGYFLKKYRSVCVYMAEGEIDAGCGPACTVRLERMPGDQLLGDLK